MTNELNKCDCTIEVECEVIEQDPIEIDIELKQYYDGAGQKKREIYFNLEDWTKKSESSEYEITLYKENYQLTDFLVNNIFLLNKDTNEYEPALANYKLKEIYSEIGVHIDTAIIIYSDYPCIGKIVLFGQDATINN